MKSGFKNFLIWVGDLLGTYILGTVIFVLLFHTPVLKGIDVLMYRGTGLLVICGLLIIVVLSLIKKFIYREIKDCCIARSNR